MRLTAPFNKGAFNTLPHPTAQKGPVLADGAFKKRSLLVHAVDALLIHSQHSHELSATNQSDAAYNYAGEATQSRSLYRRAGASDIAINKEQKLDHTGRLTEQLYAINPGLATLTLASYSYDAIGRLATKNIQPNLGSQSSIAPADWNTASTWSNNAIPSLNRATSINHTVSLGAGQQGASGKLTINAGATLNLGAGSVLTVANTDASRTALQSISYHYTTQGQLKGINLDAGGQPSTSNEKLFSYSLAYDYDGNISSQVWRSAQDGHTRSYAYAYDAAKRIVNATYTGVGAENYSISQNYDANGNIDLLQRYSLNAGSYNIVDNLSYGYQSTTGRLGQVDDATGNSLGFADSPGADYSYYPDGKLLSDANKGISLIEYNHLDLVKKLSLPNNQIVEYSYTASGERRKKKVTTNGQSVYTLYDGELELSSTDGSSYSLSEIKNAEGRFLNGSLEYGYTDHLGNLRLSYANAADGSAQITQAQNYDPWGTVLAGSEYSSTANTDKYLVSGREYQKETGYTSLDWREYDSVLGRMHSPDPIDHVSINAYNYCGNNPVVNIDPDGQSFMAIAAISLFSGHIGGMLNHARGGTYGRGFTQGFATGAIGGTAGAFAPIGFLPGATYGAGTGALAGGVGSAIGGGSFWDGAKTGAIFGGISGGTYGGIKALGKGANFWSGARPDNVEVALPGDISSLDGWDLNASNQKLSEFSENYFPGARKEYGVKYQVASRNNLPTGYGFDENFQLITKGASYINAVQDPNIWGGSTIWMSPARFTNNRFLFKTLGHELIHAWHGSISSIWSMGSAEYSNLTESVAHNWSYNMGLKFGLDSKDVLSSRSMFLSYFNKLNKSSISQYNNKYHWGLNQIFGRYTKAKY